MRTRRWLIMLLLFRSSRALRPLSGASAAVRVPRAGLASAMSALQPHRGGVPGRAPAAPTEAVIALAVSALQPHAWERMPAPTPAAEANLRGTTPEVSDAVGALVRLEKQEAAASKRGSSTLSLLLRSNAVKGVGPKLAALLHARFGEATLDVLRGTGGAADEAALRALPGLGEKTIAKIRGSMHLWDGLRAALDFGRRLSCLSEAQVSALAAAHGEHTEERVRSDPCPPPL